MTNPIRPRLAHRPDEPGWSLGSDGWWYPPELASPRFRPIEADERTDETPVIRDERTGRAGSRRRRAVFSAALVALFLTTAGLGFAMGSARPLPARGPERTATTPANAAVATAPKTTQSVGTTPVHLVTPPPAPPTAQTTVPVAVTPQTNPPRVTSVPGSVPTTIEATSVPSSSPRTTTPGTSPPATG